MIISTIIYQLTKIEKDMQQDLKDGSATINYMLCEKETKFLDVSALKQYFTETDIKNTFFLKEINNLCASIINMWNEDFVSLPDRKFKEPLVYNNEDKGRYFSSILYFNAYYLTSDKWQSFNTRTGQEYFIGNFEYTHYQIAHIAQRCANILNMITANYPETKNFENVYVKETEQTKNLKYYLQSLEDGTAAKSKLYIDAKKVIGLEKFDTLTFNDKKLKIYTPEISYVLHCSTLEVKNTSTQNIELIDTKPFLNEYYNGYLEGEKYFDENYKVSTETIFSERVELYVNDITYQYEKAEIPNKPLYRGWKYVIDYNNTILSKKELYELGYYSGIVDKVEELVNKYPNIFTKGKIKDERSDNSIDNTTNSKTLDLIKEKIEAIDDNGWKYSFIKENDYKTFTNLLTSYFEQEKYTLPDEVIKLQRRCKTRLAKALGEILRELGDGKLKEHSEYFDIIKKLNHFEKERDIYKAITR